MNALKCAEDKPENPNNLGTVPNQFAKEGLKLEMNLNRNSQKKIAINKVLHK